MNSYGLDQPLDLRLKALNLSRTFHHEPANYYQVPLSSIPSINHSQFTSIPQATTLGAHCQSTNNCSTNNSPQQQQQQPATTAASGMSQILNPPCFNQLYQSQHSIHQHPLGSYHSSEPSSHHQQPVNYPYHHQQQQQNQQNQPPFRSANIHCQPLNHLQPHPLSRLHPPPSHLQSLRAPAIPPPPPPPPTQNLASMAMNNTGPQQHQQQLQTSASSTPNTTASTNNSSCFPSPSSGQQSPKNYAIHNNNNNSHQVMSVEASAAAAAMAAAARINGQLTPPHHQHQQQQHHHHHQQNHHHQHPYHHHHQSPVPVRSLSMSSHILSSNNQLSSIMVPPTLTPPMSHNQHASNASQCFGVNGSMRQMTCTNKGDLSRQGLTKQMGSVVGSKPLSSSYDSGISTSLSASNSNSSSGLLTATVSATNMSTPSNPTITTTTTIATKSANASTTTTTNSGGSGVSSNNNNNSGKSDGRNNININNNNNNDNNNSDDNNSASPITRQHSLVSRYNCKPCGIVFSQPETLRAHQEGYCTKRDRNQTAQMRSQSAVSPSAIKNVNNSNNSK